MILVPALTLSITPFGLSRWRGGQSIVVVVVSVAR
jgi:hypothetical protein